MNKSILDDQILSFKSGCSLSLKVWLHGVIMHIAASEFSIFKVKYLGEIEIKTEFDNKIL